MRTSPPPCAGMSGPGCASTTRERALSSDTRGRSQDGLNQAQGLSARPMLGNTMRALKGACCAFAGFLRVGQRASNGAAQAVDIPGWRKPRGIVGDEGFANGRDIGGHDRHTAGHRFKEREGKAFEAGREQKQVGGTEQFGDVVAPAQEMQVICDAHNVRVVKQRSGERSITRPDDTEVGPLLDELRDRGDKRVASFLDVKAADGESNEGFLRNAERSTEVNAQVASRIVGKREAIDVDAVMNGCYAVFRESGAADHRIAIAIGNDDGVHAVVTEQRYKVIAESDRPLLPADELEDGHTRDARMDAVLNYSGAVAYAGQWEEDCIGLNPVDGLADMIWPERAINPGSDLRDGKSFDVDAGGAQFGFQLVERVLNWKQNVHVEIVPCGVRGDGGGVVFGTAANRGHDGNHEPGHEESMPETRVLWRVFSGVVALRDSTRRWGDCGRMRRGFRGFAGSSTGTRWAYLHTAI